MTADRRSPGTALITGASAGIGAAYARALAARDHDLILVARREDRLRELAGTLLAAHQMHAEVLPADLATDVGIGAVEARIASTPDLSLLVNNAGFGINASFAASDRADQVAMVRVQTEAPVRLMHAALPVMEARGGGGMINVSSIAAFLTRGGGSPTYSASKNFLNVFSQNLQSEVRADGIHVQALCAGYTLTEFHDAQRGGASGRPSMPRWMWMTPEQVVETSLAALERGRVIVIPGWRYKLIVFMMRTGLSGMVGTVRRLLKSGT